VYVGTDEPYLFGRLRVGGPDPEHRSYRSFASFKDPDGNGWLFQEVTARLPGRVDANDTTFTSSTELATALRRAAAAHGKHEKRTGQHDADWPDWYAEYIVREQAGKELPTCAAARRHRHRRRLAGHRHPGALHSVVLKCLPACPAKSLTVLLQALLDGVIASGQLFSAKPRRIARAGLPLLR
jgi:hypothetical protein